MDKERWIQLWNKLNIYCYGSGEESILIAFKKMFSTFENNRTYNYEEIIKALENEALCWSLLALLDHADFIEWGTSIRYGWATSEGEEFIKLTLNYSIEEMYDMAME